VGCSCREDVDSGACKVRGKEGVVSDRVPYWQKWGEKKQSLRRSRTSATPSTTEKHRASHLGGDVAPKELYSPCRSAHVVHTVVSCVRRCLPEELAMKSVTKADAQNSTKKKKFKADSGFSLLMLQKPDSNVPLSLFS
jgi:hypothetical protein